MPPLQRQSASMLFALLCAGTAFAQSPAPAPDLRCGDVVTIETRKGTTLRYALAVPKPGATTEPLISLVLLPGGSGYSNLDDRGCPRALTGNSLIRSIPAFGALGFVTALVDAPSDHHGTDGLVGFRIEAAHADDLGRVIADLRARSKGPVWVVGTSRGAISAVNAASRLTGAAAPDGVVLTSALMVGQFGAKLPWVAHSVFDLALESIRVPVLVVGHGADPCPRSPASRMNDITARTNGVREQVVTVTGGPGWSGPPSLAACEGRSPHGFVEQEVDVAHGIARFIRGGTY